MAALLTLSQTPIEATLDDLKWFDGHWEGKGLGGEFEEHWLPAKGGSMLGVFRLVAGEKLQVSEYMFLEQDGKTIKMLIRHFAAGHRAWEEKDSPIALPLIEKGPTRAVFVNASEGRMPKRIVYNLKGDDLTVVVDSEHDGEPERLELEFRRIEPR
ncbi:hypothetical protein EON81_19815 [bacterium]|nr:MAG: hypothetical protein EON81_19815 [bacterium]